MGVVKTLFTSSNFWTMLSGLGGAALGGFITYRTQIRIEKRDRKERRRNLLRKYIIFVSKVYWIMNNLDKDFLKPLKQDTGRHIKLPPIHIVLPVIDVDDPAADLLFIDSERDIAHLIAKLYNYKDYYQGFLQVLEKRNVMHAGEFQEAITIMHNESDSEYVTDELVRKGVGIRIWNSLRDFTDAMYEDCEYLLQAQPEIRSELDLIAKELFPGEKFIEMALE